MEMERLGELKDLVAKKYEHEEAYGRLKVKQKEDMEKLSKEIDLEDIDKAYEKLGEVSKLVRNLQDINQEDLKAIHDFLRTVYQKEIDFVFLVKQDGYERKCHLTIRKNALYELTFKYDNRRSKITSPTTLSNVIAVGGVDLKNKMLNLCPEEKRKELKEVLDYLTISSSGDKSNEPDNEEIEVNRVMPYEYNKTEDTEFVGYEIKNLKVNRVSYNGGERVYIYAEGIDGQSIDFRKDYYGEFDELNELSLVITFKEEIEEMIKRRTQQKIKLLNKLQKQKEPYTLVLSPYLIMREI